MAPHPDYTQGPLNGLRIIDLSRVIAGPYAGRLFRDMGAEVIKLEPPEGDTAREIAPRHDRGMSATLFFGNVGKRSLSVDLTRPGARSLVHELLATADAVIENFRPGVLDRLGLGWEALHAAHPRVCMLSINGFGTGSTWEDRRAYAPIVHAVTGILHDQAQYSGGPIAQRNEAHADTVSALHGAFALLAALRVAAATGVGQRVEVPMFDAVLTTYNQVGTALLDEPDHRVMNPIYDAGPNGSIAVAGSAAHIWSTLAGARAEIVDPTPAGAAPAEKARHRHRAVEVWMATHVSLREVLSALASAGLACAPVVPLRDALTSPLAKERDLLVHVDDRRGGARAVVRPAARFSSARNEVRGTAPRRGEHNREVLAELLGYTPERIAALEAEGVLVPPRADES
jgi:crotonobetainyl-CoA:carnitine CoA-transferase CaiB-like acyl-CoA transferase